MSKPKVKVLLLEDEPSMMKLLLHFFNSSSQVEYELTSATGLSDCVRLADSFERGFDVWILDLTLADCQGEMPGGLLPLLCQTMGPSPMNGLHMRVIYTASQAPEHQAMALKCNATHFVSKAEVLPHQLVSYISDEVRLQLRRANQSEVARKFFLENFSDLVSLYGGKHIVMTFVNDCPRIVHSASTRIEAFVTWYRENPGSGKPQQAIATETLESLPFIVYVPNDGD